jgi:SulP family sulfate permease
MSAPSRVRSDTLGSVTLSDVVAGVSVALIVIPQSMAYAELAGLPPHHGLYAASLPLIAFALIGSSPYLQTGPVALTALLTLGALSPLAPVGGPQFVQLAALLAVVVGVARVVIGWVHGGWLLYLMSRSMMTGFLAGAAILIVASQLPGALGSEAVTEGVLGRAWWSLTTAESWDVEAIGLSLATVAVIVVCKRIHAFIPGVLIATVGGILYSVATAYEGGTIGAVAAGFPLASLNLPWASIPNLLLPGIVISLVGFAEGASIARLFASQDRARWDADRELLGSGLANLVAGVTSGLPVGGSVSRTSVNRLAGARTRWSGLITGVSVLAFLPFAAVLSPLPRAVLAGVVMAAVSGLMRPREFVSVWTISRPQGLVSLGTFTFTLILAPRIDLAILVGLALSTSAHLWREMTPLVDGTREGSSLHLAPSGVLWFGSAAALEERILGQLSQEPDVTKVVVSLGALGRIDLTGAYTLMELADYLREAGVELQLVDVPGHAIRVLSGVGLRQDGGPAGPDPPPDRGP